MKEIEYKVIDNVKVALDTFRLRLAGPTDGITRPGQFVQLGLEGLFLRRPFSVADCSSSELTLIYKVVGKGTEQMKAMKEGDSLSAIVGLGNGFDASRTREHALVVGGSVGVAPLLPLCRALLAGGKKVSVALGFNSADLMFYVDELKALGIPVAVATADGSYDIKGLVTSAIDRFGGYDYFYCCGSTMMMKAVAEYVDCPGELSMDERMGCGTGICYGCSIRTTDGPRRVCADGPVFRKEEIIW